MEPINVLWFLIMLSAILLVHRRRCACSALRGDLTHARPITPHEGPELGPPGRRRSESVLSSE
jgi:hypothetical protein